MAIDFNQLATQVAQAFGSKLVGAAAPLAQQFQDQLRALARIGVAIEAGKVAGTITKGEAQLMMDNQRLILEMVAFGIAGQAKVAVEKAINAALDVVVNAVNSATHLGLLRPT